MTSEIVVALIVGAFSLAGTIISNYTTNRKYNALLSYKIESLEKEVQKHNVLIENHTKYETEIVTLKTIVAELERRLDKYEKR